MSLYMFYCSAVHRKLMLDISVQNANLDLEYLNSDEDFAQEADSSRDVVLLVFSFFGA